MEPDPYLVPTPRAMKKALGALPGNSVSKKSSSKPKKPRLVVSLLYYLWWCIYCEVCVCVCVCVCARVRACACVSLQGGLGGQLVVLTL